MSDSSDSGMTRREEQFIVQQGLALLQAGLLTPGEARQWIEQTKEDYKNE